MLEKQLLGERRNQNGGGHICEKERLMAKLTGAVDPAFRNLISFIPARQTSEQREESQVCKESKKTQSTHHLGTEAKTFYESLISGNDGKTSSNLSREKHVPSSKGETNDRRIRKRRKSQGHTVENDRNKQTTEFFTPQALNPDHRQHLKLLQSSQLGQVSAVEDLLISGLDVNFQDFYGWTPLMCAANDGHSSVVKILLESGADKSLCNSTGVNAISLARNAGHTKLAEEIKRFVKRSRLENPAEESSLSEDEMFYCDICKRDFTLKDQKAHFSSTVHLFNSGKKSSGPAFLIPESNRGFQMLLRSGWSGDRGLGPDGKGVKYPVKTILKQDRKGFGVEEDGKKKAKITHFNARDKKAVQGREKVRREMSVRTIAKNAQRLKEKREKRWEKNLSGKKSSGPAFLIPESNHGFQMLLRSVWSGDRGLGPDGKGVKYPVKTILKQDRTGFEGEGDGKKKAKITHFNARDKRTVQAREKVKRVMSVRTIAKNAQRLREKREKKRWEKNMRYEFS